MTEPQWPAAEIRGPDGRICDHLVVMRRMPAARRLSALVRSGAPVAVPLRRVARILAAQHAGAARNPEVAEQGSRDAARPLGGQHRPDAADPGAAGTAAAARTGGH